MWVIMFFFLHGSFAALLRGLSLFSTVIFFVWRIVGCLSAVLFFLRRIGFACLFNVAEALAKEAEQWVQQVGLSVFECC